MPKLESRHLPQAVSGMHLHPCLRPLWVWGAHRHQCRSLSVSCLLSSQSTLCALCVEDCVRDSGPLPIPTMGNGHSLGTTPSALQKHPRRLCSCRSRLARRLSLAAPQTPLAQTCCQECIVCPLMQCPSLVARNMPGYWSFVLGCVHCMPRQLASCSRRLSSG